MAVLPSLFDEVSEPEPIATLNEPVVLFNKELEPNELLAAPLVVFNKAWYPIPVLLLDVL